MGPVILIDNVTADDAGDYTCEVMSEAGTTNSSIAIRGECVEPLGVGSGRCLGPVLDSRIW